MMATHGKVFLGSEQCFGGAGAGMQPRGKGKGRSRAGGKQCLMFWGTATAMERGGGTDQSRAANWMCFSPETLENLVKQENKGSSLPWPPACSASHSCQPAWCSSCILERTKHTHVTGRKNTLMSHCQLLCVLTHSSRLIPLSRAQGKVSQDQL